MALPTHVVMFSGGAGSWAAARRVREGHGTSGLVLLFADTRQEDADLYRFIHEAALDVGGQLVTVADGRTPWDVFFDVRFLGNTRIDPCSRILKRELLRTWLKEHTDPATTTVYLGYSWDEEHRVEGGARHWAPWRVQAPLTESPYLTKDEIFAHLRAAGIEPPRLYTMGFQHNNCGGFCVKAGQAQFRLLLQQFPERYRYHEEKEQELRAVLGKDVTILRDRTGGETRPLTMREFRERMEQDEQNCDLFEWGGCGCFHAQED